MSQVNACWSPHCCFIPAHRMLQHIPIFALSPYSPYLPTPRFLYHAPPGHVTLSDVDGAGLLEEGLLRTTQLVAAQAAAQAAAMCLDPAAAEAAVWRAADLIFAQEAPTMITDAVAPLEFKAFHVMCGASHQHLLGPAWGPCWRRRAAWRAFTL